MLGSTPLSTATSMALFLRNCERLNTELLLVVSVVFGGQLTAGCCRDSISSRD